MYNNQYLNAYNPQMSIDRINAQMAELEQMKQRLQQPAQQPSINQTFQLAPNNQNGMRFANSIDEVQKSVITMDTPFFSNDMSVLWIKNAKGEIKTFEMKEIVPLDSKDIKIQYLEAQIEELKGMIRNESINTNVSNDDAEQNATNTTTDDKSVGATIKEGKSTNVQKVSRSKTK